jgi:hypothetical protein
VYPGADGAPTEEVTVRRKVRILLLVLAATAVGMAMSGVPVLAEQIGPGGQAPVAEQIGPGGT